MEGIDVLYSTNTYFIESQDLLDALFCPGPSIQHVILPERLATITSLELTWDIMLFGQLPSSTQDRQNIIESDRVRTADREKVASHLRCIGEFCPNLRRLVLSFTEGLYRDGRVQPRLVLDKIDHLLFRPIAEAVVGLPLPQKRPVVVELPYNVFVDLRHAAYNRLMGLEPPVESQYGDLWLRYPLPVKGEETIPSDEQSPCATSASNVQYQDDRCGDRHSFYYIKEGTYTDLFWNYKGIAQSASLLGGNDSCWS